MESPEVTLDESPEVTLDTEKLEAKLNRSDFAQVVFQNVAETYPPGAHIECHYTLTIAIKPTSRDWVGLYKVGWTSVKDYQTFNYVSTPAREGDKDIEATVLFSAYYLPKEDGEFYQFVYVNKNGEVKGASTPFQFKNPSADDFIEIEDEHTDMLLIKTKTAFCEERLNQATEEKTKLTRQLRLLEDNHDGLKKKVTELEQELQEEQKNYTQMEGWYKKALSTSTSIEAEKHTLTLRVTAAENNTEKLTEDLKEKENKLKELEDKLKSTEGNLEDVTKMKEDLERQLEDNKKQIEIYKEQFTAAETQNQTLQTQVKMLKSQLSNTDQSLVETKVEATQLQSRIDEERRKFERQLHVTSADKEHMSTLEAKVKNFEDKIAALEETKTLLTEELDALKQVQYSMSKTLEVKTDEAGNLKTQLRRQTLAFQEKESELKEEIKALRDGLTQLAEEKEKLVKDMYQKEKEHEGPLFALQEVNRHLKERYDKLKKQHEDFVKQREDLVKKHVALEQEKSDYQREIDDLKERLEMGAAAWTEKYKECIKLEGKVRKLKKSTSMIEQSSSSQENSLDKTEREALQKSSLDSCESKTLDEPIAFDSVLHTQLNELERELEERNKKANKYKQMWKEEVTKVEDVENRYKENLDVVSKQLSEKTEQCEKLDKELQSEKQKSQDKERCLEEEIELLREEFEKEKSEKEKKDVAYMELLKQFEGSNMSIRMASVYHHGDNNNTVPDGEPGSASLYGNPYEDEARQLQQRFSHGMMIGRGLHVHPALSRPPIPPPPVVGHGWPILTPTPHHPGLPTPHLPGLPTPHLPGLPTPLIPQRVHTPPTTNNNTETTDQPDDLAEELDGNSEVSITMDAGNNVVQPPPSVDETIHEDRDDVGQEFHDAPEYPAHDSAHDGVPRWCPECRLLFPPSCPKDTFDEHVQSHYGRVCPMCSLKFAKTDAAQDEFERHVQHHFEQDN